MPTTRSYELSRLRLRLQAFVWLVIVTAVGYWLKFYSGPGREWINNYGPASIPYEMMLMLTAFLVFPRRSCALPIAIGVCALTCALEFAQLWHPPWLQALRSTVIGKALLGTTFSWWDLPAYPLGCAVGYVFLLWLTRETTGDTGVKPTERAEA